MANDYGLVNGVKTHAENGFPTHIAQNPNRLRAVGRVEIAGEMVSEPSATVLDDMGADSSLGRRVFGPIYDVVDQTLKDVSDRL